MIKMISGACRTEEGIKRPGDKPFSLEPAAEYRLVRRRVAEYVQQIAPLPQENTVPTPPDGGDNDGETGKDQPDNADAADGQENSEDGGKTLCIVDGHFTKESLLTMTRAEMEELAEDLGVDIKKCKNKPEIAELLSAVEVEPGEPCTEDGEDLPDLGAEDPVT